MRIEKTLFAICAHMLRHHLDLLEHIKAKHEKIKDFEYPQCNYKSALEDISNNILTHVGILTFDVNL